MPNDWRINGIFAALTAAAFYFAQLTMVDLGFSKAVAVPISAIVSGALVGVGLRWIVTELLPRLSWVRRIFDGYHPIAGMWLEVLDRRGEQHYSIVEIRYDPSATGSSYVMIGHSFFPSGDTHSEWGSCWVRLKSRSNGVLMKYLYEVERLSDEADNEDEPDGGKYGYGESTFRRMVGVRSSVTRGSGYYLAAEECPPYRCSYRLRRIDAEYKKRIGAAKGKLKTTESMREFVRKAHAFESSDEAAEEDS